MSHRLPEKGLWHLASGHRVDAAPFDLIKLDFRGIGTGTAKGIVRARNLETRLGRIRVTGPDRFVAAYEVRGHRGTVEGTLRSDGSLRLELSGTATGTFVARRPDAADTADMADAEPAGADAGPAVRAFAGAMQALRRSAGMTRSAAA